MHLAAVAHANRSNKDPFSTFDHSMRTLENALDWARGVELEHFIFFSSSMVYGNFRPPTVTEDHPLDPIGIYGALKLGGEKLVIAYNQVFGLPYTIIRPSALYGPRCVSRRVGQAFIESALVGRDAARRRRRRRADRLHVHRRRGRRRDPLHRARRRAQRDLQHDRRPGAHAARPGDARAGPLPRDRRRVRRARRAAPLPRDAVDGQGARA